MFYVRLVLLAVITVASPAAAQVEGVVHDAEGEPAANVAVLLVGPGDNPDIINGRIGGLWGADLSSTDENGRFHFVATPEGTYRLIALGEAGCGESDVLEPGDAVPTVELGAWSTIEGVAKIGGIPGAGAEISGSLSEPLVQNWGIVPAADYWIQIHADPQGRFKLDRLKPGLWRVAQDVPFAAGADYTYPSHPTAVEVEAGKSAEVVIGGDTGRSVTGRMLLPELDPPLSARLAMLQNDWPTPGRKPPKTFGKVEAMTPAEKMAYSQTEGFAAYERVLERDLARRQFYVITVQPDGTFRADGVPAGEYNLYIEVRQPGDGGKALEVDRRIVVPEGTGPLDLGELSPSEKVNLAVGDTMPDVTFKDVDGKEFKLSDFRSQYVLLDAWATWCGPCVGETPNILDVQQAYADDDRLVILGLSMDDSTDAPRDYARRKGLTWINGFIGEWDATEVDERLGIGGIPDIRLIGPDGKLVAEGLRGEEIREAVEAALGQPLPSVEE